MQMEVQMNATQYKAGNKKSIYLKLLFLLFGLFLPACIWAAKAQVGGKMYKSPSCGCCEKWASYMKENGYSLESVAANMQEIKEKYKIPQEMQSCHTAIINGYFFEGHIPVEDIKDFLKKHPSDSAGLAVPGMPIGSPGMEQSTFIEPYNVYLVKKNGDISVWSQH